MVTKQVTGIVVDKSIEDIDSISMNVLRNYQPMI